VKEAYSDAYRSLYERHWWWRARERAIIEVLTRLRPPAGFDRALDVGCGDGLLFPVLRRFARDVEGVEPYAPLTMNTSELGRVIHRVPFDDRFAPDEKFSLVVMLDVLEHLDDDVAALRVARRLLAPRGILLITVPAFAALWTRHDDINEHRRRYDTASLARACSIAGLRVRSSRYFFHWLAPVKLLARRIEALSGGRPPRIPRVPPSLLNRALIALSRLEFAATRHASLPFGSSLLMVADADDVARPVSASAP
jgi:SAM-dependent methyltransferase